MVPPTSRIRWFFLASAVLSIAVAWGLALPLLGAAVLAFVSERPIDFILEKLRRRHDPRVRWIVSTAFVLLIVTGLLIPLTFAAIGAIREAITLISSIRWDSAGSQAERYIDWARNRASSLGFDIPEQEVSDRIRSALASSFSFLGARLGTLISSTPTIAFDVVILLFAWVVFAVEGRAARERVLPKLLPWDVEREILRKTTGEVLRSVLVANVVVSIAQASICSIALLIAGMPRALVWGTLSFFLSFVPVVGTLPITASAAIYCYSQGRVGSAIFMVAVAAVIGLVDNILRPIFMKSSANLSFLVDVRRLRRRRRPLRVAGCHRRSTGLLPLHRLPPSDGDPPGSEKPPKGLPLTATPATDSDVRDGIPSGEYTAVTTPPPERVPAPALLLPPAPGGKNRKKKRR